MGPLSVAGIFTALICFAAAFPATNSIPTAINQAAAGDANDSDPTVNSSKVIPNAFDRRFPIPSTNTVLLMSEGTKVDRIPLQIFLARMQMDVNERIAKHGPAAIPGRNPSAPQYQFLSRTPGGTEGYFFVSAQRGGGLTYQLINDVLTGLKMFLLAQGNVEQLVFEVEESSKLMAFGGLSLGPQAQSLLALSNDPSLADDPTSLAGITDMDIRLRCTFGRQLHPAVIALLLSETLDDVKEKIRTEGIRGHLPGVAGEWERDGHRGCVFRIDGIPPAHITWQIAQGVVVGLKAMLVEDHIPREAQCTMTIGPDLVGMASVKINVLGAEEE
ncbi:MAG: hypothetical protein LQ345_007086 [Seirophora villosa]|nr:MAG: hypothetical protein LQ345_007086 [Seirophora villosa]